MSPSPPKLASTADFDALLQAVGETLTNWSHVETGLFRIFHAAIHAPALGPSSAAFVAVENVRAKLSMTNAALLACKPSEHDLKLWDKLKKRCNSESLERNRLAHAKVFLLQIGDRPINAVLGPYDHDLSFMTAKGQPDQRKIKRLANVQEINRRFVSLGRDLHKFARKLGQPISAP